ncbi:uncharacterized protein SAPINGB_P004364 [Magnusiomyces paraingens]|uniref:Uncharacterized protein n=1 Tax=Magnusiomyces paraingens TaxID=2606893 RepID=A0A5E8BV57_9ASCO|nr:uncharacterized protein SAPINGB_P004364 [Saprochaete ingens]VVT54991.1 unnamed protein product [Saprochaete ingens]
MSQPPPAQNTTVRHSSPRVPDMIINGCLFSIFSLETPSQRAERLRIQARDNKRASRKRKAAIGTSTFQKISKNSPSSVTQTSNLMSPSVQSREIPSSQVTSTVSAPTTPSTTTNSALESSSTTKNVSPAPSDTPL